MTAALACANCPGGHFAIALYIYFALIDPPTSDSELAHIQDGVGVMARSSTATPFELAADITLSGTTTASSSIAQRLEWAACFMKHFLVNEIIELELPCD
jgi:hypothetical protein